MTSITINVGENEKKFLMRLSEKYNASIEELIREAIQEYWEEEYYSFFKRVADTPQTELTAKCLNCHNAKACKENHWDGCIYEPQTDCSWK